MTTPTSHFESNGDIALRLYNLAIQYIKSGNLDMAEEIVKQMHPPSDQMLIRKKIEEMRKK